jgi:hypothetical protein
MPLESAMGSSLLSWIRANNNLDHRSVDWHQRSRRFSIESPVLVKSTARHVNNLRFDFHLYYQLQTSVLLNDEPERMP